ncbi:MAG TPA: GNAT family N-acetyltransferase [Spirochaetia bacterium]|nr:GNAT family N-acetyltransferase [Spirochaetia bacterium]
MGDIHTGSRDLHYKPVTRQTIVDLLRLMEKHRTFASCACMRCRLRPARFEALSSRRRREAMQGLVERGSIVGILAYRIDTPVAWCSVAPRESFAALPASHSRAPAEDTAVWTVTCFWVTPALRRRGIASALLRAAVEYARTHGARMVEGYPVPAGHPDQRMGSPDIFRRAGFRDVTSEGRRRRVMRNVVG